MAEGASKAEPVWDTGRLKAVRNAKCPDGRRRYAQVFALESATVARAKVVVGRVGIAGWVEHDPLTDDWEFRCHPWAKNAEAFSGGGRERPPRTEEPRPDPTGRGAAALEVAAGETAEAEDQTGDIVRADATGVARARADIQGDEMAGVHDALCPDGTRRYVHILLVDSHLEGRGIVRFPDGRAAKGRVVYDTAARDWAFHPTGRGSEIFTSTLEK